MAAFCLMTLAGLVIVVLMVGTVTWFKLDMWAASKTNNVSFAVAAIYVVVGMHWEMVVLPLVSRYGADVLGMTWYGATLGISYLFCSLVVGTWWAYYLNWLNDNRVRAHFKYVPEYKDCKVQGCTNTIHWAQYQGWEGICPSCWEKDVRPDVCLVCGEDPNSWDHSCTKGGTN